MAYQTVYQRLFDAYGPQHWWPGETPFEIMVGAILTQNTAWTNVERAIANLQSADLLDPAAIVAADLPTLATCLRPSGYFNVKAERLRAFCDWFLTQGGLPGLSDLDTTVLRRALLAVKGVGPETADDILLYAFERPVFVVDSYTRRIFSRLGLVAADIGYEPLRARFEHTLEPDVALFNEYHALIVRHGKAVCRPKPRCAECCLRPHCHWPGD